MAYKILIRLTLFLFGASLLMLTGLLWIARQPEAQSAGRAFITDYGDGLHVYRLWRNGRGVRAMTHDADEITTDGQLAWSPDGRWLAYVDMNMHIVSAGGGIRIRLTNSTDRSPSWSPDGRSLAFLDSQIGNSGIYVIDRPDQGSPRRRISGLESALSGPAWSPDGEWIVFSSFRNSDYDIFRVRPDGSELQNLTDSEYLSEFSPVWSSDGIWIHFQLRSDIFQRMRLDGTGWENVNGETRDIIDQSHIPPINLDWRPAWPLILGLAMLGIVWRTKP